MLQFDTFPVRPYGLRLRASVASSLQKKPSSLSETTPPPRIRRGRVIWQRRLERKQSYPSAETPASDVGRREREDPAKATDSVLTPLPQDEDNRRVAAIGYPMHAG